MDANTGTEVRKYHREMDVYFQTLKNISVPERSSDMNIEELRNVSEKRSKLLSGTPEFDGSDREILVPSCHNADGIPVSVYTPSSLGAIPSILICLHGGGFIGGTRQSIEVACKSLARIANCIILNVEYRLAPEHKMPAAIDDAAEVVTWVLANKQNVGGTGESVVGLAGHSSGGTITAAVCHEISGIKYQILINAKFDQRTDRPSAIAFDDCPVGPNLAAIHFINETAFDKNDTSGRYTPMDREKFDSLPPALFIASEYDPLRDDSYDYEKKLKEAGVKTEFLLVKGVLHNFFTYPRIFKETTKLAYDKVAKFIQQYS